MLIEITSLSDVMNNENPILQTIVLFATCRDCDRNFNWNKSHSQYMCK